MSEAVLVTGATGFVGQALVRSLAAGGRPVVALVRQPSAALPPGVTQRVAAPIETLDKEGWRSALQGIDTAVHLAAIAHIGPGVAASHYDAVNHRAVAALGEAARMAGLRRVVFLSSIRAQCGASSDRIETEASPEQPTDAYGIAKLAGERALAASGAPHVILRPVLIAGDEPKGNLALLARLARSGLPLPLAGISARRSMVSLADVVAAIEQAIDDTAMLDQRFILADPEALSVGETVAVLRSGLGMTPRLFGAPEALLALPFRLIGRGDIWQRIGGTLVARPEGLMRTGFTPRRSVRATLEAMGRPPAR